MPPAALVERVAARFLATSGDLRETVRAVVDEPRVLRSGHFRAKIKSPFEYAVSAVRALGADDGRARARPRAIAEMGEPLYLCQPPTGYSEAADAWVNSGALLARMNFALSLAAQSTIPGTPRRPGSLPPDGASQLEALDGEARAPRDRRSPLRPWKRSGRGSPQAPADPAAKRARRASSLGSPEFQRQ